MKKCVNGLVFLRKNADFGRKNPKYQFLSCAEAVRYNKTMS